jgi:hypothetical protein
MNKQNTKVSSAYTVEPTMESIIAMDAPAWHTKKIWEEYQSQFEELKNRFSLEEDFRELMFQELCKNLTLEFQKNRGSLRTYLSSKILKEKFMSGLLFSTPDTGQDPKMVNDHNLREAGKHAARHWGSNVNGVADWITYLSLNVVIYPNGKIVFKPVNGEHRLWGIIGFQLGLVRLISPDGKDLFFYSNKLHGGSIRVNDLNLSEIVELANDNLVDRHKMVTEQEVLDRFNGNTVPIELLPMYNNAECSTYFREVNDSASDKKSPQMLHAFSDFANSRIRTFGSIKNHKFYGSDDKLHRFVDKCFTLSQNVKLSPFMYIHMIAQFEIEKDFVKSTDDALFANYLRLRAYENYYDVSLKFEKRILESMAFLYDVFKFYPEKKTKYKNPSKQLVQQVLMIRKHLIQNGLRILDTKLFMEKFYSFVKLNSNKVDLSTGIINTKERLPFGTDMANSSTSNYESAWKYIRKHFLGNGKSYLSMKSEDELFEIGIVPIGSELPRLFPNGTIKLSALQNKGLDIDGVSFEEKGAIPVGGHIISDWELNQLSDYERDIAAKREGCFLNNEFEFTQNCRAMSKYHNDRMGVLPLSIYMEVINESDKVIREREKQFREEVTSRLSKYHKAA